MQKSIATIIKKQTEKDQTESHHHAIKKRKLNSKQAQTWLSSVQDTLLLHKQTVLVSLTKTTKL